MAVTAETIRKTTNDPLVIAGRMYSSRLLVGTGKYKDLEQTRRAVEASGAQIITIAVRRTNIGQNPNEPSLTDVLSPEKYTYLPNTAGCYSAEDAIRTCRLARELLDGHDLVKLEVLGSEKTLYPDIPQTLTAAEVLIKDGFKVMVYTNDDPIVARRFAEMGCVAVMPLAAPIGSGLGIRNPYNIRFIVEEATVPILVDAGRGHGQRRRHCHGARLRRRADEHRHRRGAEPGAHGAGHEKSGRGRARGLSRRPHAAQAIRLAVVAARRNFLLKFLPREIARKNITALHAEQS